MIALYVYYIWLKYHWNDKSFSWLEKLLNKTVEPIVSVQTDPKFAHIISIPSFYTFQHLNKIRLNNNELHTADFMCV